jgi:hypothetical protein
MSAFILITGTLFRDPEQRTSKNGKPFVTATLRVKDGNESHTNVMVKVLMRFFKPDFVAFPLY